ncbi:MULTISPECIES: hypothetical protein [Natrinema]|uniref:Uncharacterized protein n=1 Tax=Natrinema gari JCM 14663 TaxID=1230459 RepID=L9YT92_9EURY|nr:MULTISPECIES: hypothetical protein [Natrinema]AFO58920.1 hypothetical protein NJ7G_3704 [Natrinema sp. J7-2]ELY77354.1 hypothetical protein C486_16308 [Natrinema gari JCM 14663]
MTRTSTAVQAAVSNRLETTETTIGSDLGCPTVGGPSRSTAAAREVLR